jgi:tRNA pseudouridine32 synthase / 23S rRNA pseudouridine746 synthase
VNPSLAQTIFETVGCDMGRMDQMVVHRLGFDTSGLMVFCKTMEALRGMNEIFRTRAIEKKYEALVCGHISDDVESGILNMPLMRDYEFPPFMRVSTGAHQGALMDLDPEQLTNPNLLEMPKESLTKYKVVAREELFGLPVTRVALTSLSGRTHQLNVHLAAFGHPIVGDTTYGIDGDAAANGGLTQDELDSIVPNANRASDELQRRIARSANGKITCIHAKSLKFRHPTTGDEIAFVADAPF